MPHRALHIVEMLIRICQNANDATLAVLARTSRSFHHPAVQTLWSELVDLSPLIKCFPVSAWTTESNTLVCTY